MLPNRLRAGDAIGVISPSHIADPARYQRMFEGLQSFGFRVLPGRNLFSNTYGYGATERERADDFNAMIADPDVRMVLFGGGEGGNELLPYIDFEAVVRNPKLILSYSDGTTILNAVHALTGLITFYGQTPGLFDNLSHYDFLQLEAHCVEGGVAAYRPGSAWRVAAGGACEGTLIGGYLRNFALLLGSPYFSWDESRKYLLFLEDHEKFSGVDAVSSYLSHIEQSGFMARVSGVLFGHYSTEEHPELLARLARMGERYGVPVAWCDDFGHGVRHAILPIGREAHMDVDAQSITF